VGVAEGGIALGVPEEEVRVVELKAAEREISPRDLCAKLQPFKELVADDIEQDGES
jgi:hypothetical protein